MSHGLLRCYYLKKLIAYPHGLHKIIAPMLYHDSGTHMAESASTPQDLILEKDLDNGTRRNIDSSEYIFYDGYWIRYYAPLKDTLGNRKRLIDSLTRRAFHHTEAGINTPGKSLDQARAAYQNETNPARKRVNAAMLAGALFNRATDLFTSIVDLGELGVQVSRTNELMRECSQCFQEALTLGQQVKHRSGCEGIDEVWGEPFKAFTMSMAEFYQSRFVKIAQGMRDIDLVAECIIENFCVNSLFAELRETIVDYASAARQTAETMKKDPIIFRVWPNFVALGEQIEAFKPNLPTDAAQMLIMRVAYGRDLIQEGRALIGYIASARVPMPLSTRLYIEKCRRYRKAPLP